MHHKLLRAIVLLGLLVIGFRLREPLLIRLFPKLVLSSAIADACDRLEEHYGSGPAALLLNGLDASGNQTILLKTDAGLGKLGSGRLELEICTQTKPNRIRANGTILTGAGKLSLNLYLDKDCAAIASGQLTDGVWYGVTFDTFREDIAGFELAEVLAGQEMLENWADALTAVSELLERSYQIPNIQPQDIRSVLMGVLAFKPAISVQKGKGQYRISFSADGKELSRLAGAYSSILPNGAEVLLGHMEADPESMLTVVFCLNSRKISGIEAFLRLGDSRYRLQVSLKEGFLLIETEEQEETSRFFLRSDADERRCSQTMIFTDSEKGEQLRLDYSWDRLTGDMALVVSRDGRNCPVRLNLTGQTGGFTVTCRDISPVWLLVTGREMEFSAICTLTVSTGSHVPELETYKNLSQWSLEDLFWILKRAGLL